MQACEKETCGQEVATTEEEEKMKWELAIRWIAKMLAAVLPLVTPSIKKELEKFLVELHAKALRSKNPVDDYLTKFLLDLMGIEYNDE